MGENTSLGLKLSALIGHLPSHISVAEFFVEPV